MAGSKILVTPNDDDKRVPSRTAGSLGHMDAADPNIRAKPGDSGGTIGFNDAAQALTTEKLVLLGTDGDWLVFNREAYRDEVSDYLWGPSFNATPFELIPKTGGLRKKDGLQFEIPDTNWRLPTDNFIPVRRGLHEKIRPAVKKLIDSLPNFALQNTWRTPVEWIPQDVWSGFTETKEMSKDGIYRFIKRSPMETDIILIKRNGKPFGGYTEASTDEDKLFEEMKVAPPSLVRRLLGAEKPQQAKIRWLAKANAKYNDFMWQQVQSGVSPRKASSNHREAVHRAYIEGFTKLLGGISGIAGHPAGEDLRKMGVDPTIMLPGVK